MVFYLLFASIVFGAQQNLDFKDQKNYRVYDQTAEFVLQKKQEYFPLRHKKMGIWEAFRLLDTLVDENDPNLSLPQSYRSFQTAEALRKNVNSFRRASMGSRGRHFSCGMRLWSCNCFFLNI